VSGLLKNNEEKDMLISQITFVLDHSV
jgi:hypothetical protein